MSKSEGNYLTLIFLTFYCLKYKLKSDGLQGKYQEQISSLGIYLTDFRINSSQSYGFSFLIM